MEVRFFDGGFCRQMLGLIDRRSWRWTRFHAIYIAAHHPSEGWILIDTGYGGRFLEATRRWPYLLYRWATPVKMNGSTSAVLTSAGIDCAKIRHLVVTHFHADHIGGLAEFARCQVHYHDEAYSMFQAIKPFAQARSAFLPALVPAGLAKQSHVIASSKFVKSADCPFPTYDLFGDGLIRLVHLPGHAPGHLGVILQTLPRPIFYVSDAYWRMSQIKDSIDLLPPVLRLQWDPPAYRQTISRLRKIYREDAFRLLACHDLATQALIFDTASAV